MAAFLMAGALLSGFGRQQAAHATAQGLRHKSILLDKSADEILKLNEENAEALRDQIKDVQGQASTKFAQSGFATDIDALADIALAGAKEINIRTKQAEREAASRNLEAALLRRNASNTRKAGNIAAATSIFSAAGAAS